jgi:hypothetical protein
LESEVGAQLSDVNSMCSIQLFYQELRILFIDHFLSGNRLVHKVVHHLLSSW